MSSNVLFCPINNPKHKDVQFTLILNRDQQILTLDRKNLRILDVFNKILNNLNNEQNDEQNCSLL